MALPRATTRPDDKSLPALASELWQLVVAYAKQETLVPVKGLGRFLAWGVAGAAVLSLGLALLALALLRALQTETDTTFSGDWSWAPYGITLVACSVAAVLAVRAIGSHKRRAARKGTIR
ncbi:MAG: hypothetical protein ACRD0S_05135 [Acidimicrobiales bacterium]